MDKIFEKKALLFNDFITEANHSVDRDNQRFMNSIYKRIENLNKLINAAFDSDGDPIPVIDKSGTYEMPDVYSPITYDGYVITIKSTEVNGGKETIDTYDVYPYLEFNNKPDNEDEEFPQGYYAYQDLSDNLRSIENMYSKLFRKK